MILYYCQKCGKAVEIKFGSGKYCNRSCANSRTFSKETNEKRAESNRKAWYKSHPKGSVFKKTHIVRVYKHKEKQKVFCNCAYCGKQIDISTRKKNPNGRYFCNGTCRNLLLNSTKEIGGFYKGYNISAWEKIFQEVLTEHKIDFEANKRDLIKSHYEIDIWLPKYKMAIELNGIWHYSSKPYGGNEEALKRRQTKDKIKQDEVLALGYQFVVIEDRQIIDKDYKKFFEKFVEEKLT